MGGGGGGCKWGGSHRQNTDKQKKVLTAPSEEMGGGGFQVMRNQHRYPLILKELGVGGGGQAKCLGILNTIFLTNHL